MQAIKESAANIAASAKSGLEKTKAVLQEKVDQMNAQSPREREMATKRKEERIHHAEFEKQAERERNAAARSAAESGGGGESPMAGSKMSALPGHGAGEPAAGNVSDQAGAMKSNPVGTAASAVPTAAANTHVGGGSHSG